MARYIALDWDRIEARVIVARATGNEISIDKVAAVPITLDGQGQDTNFDGLEEQLKSVLRSERPGKAPVLAAIGRSAIELRTLKLPPAPEDELPEMVRFQAMREFSSLTEETPLDFVALGDAAQEPGEVVAAAIPLDLSRQLDNALIEQGCEIARSTLRPCSASSLAMRRDPKSAVGVSLVIAQQADSAELSVVKNGMVVFTRSFRLPAGWHPGETGEPLLGEVRRTIVAAQNQLSGTKIDRIVMFGTETEHAGLRERLEDRTKLDVTLLDPFEGIRVSGAPAEQPERFAALIGMLKDEAAAVRPAFDFQNPRKKPEPESHSRTYLLYAATAATVALGLVFLVWWQFNSLNKKISKQKLAINALKRDNKYLAPEITLQNKLDHWKKGDKNWIEELHYISTSDELTPDDFRVETLSARSLTSTDNTGIIELSVRARDGAKKKLQDALYDDDHAIVSGTSTVKKDDERYPAQFKTSITLKPERSFALQPPNAVRNPSQPTGETTTADDANMKEDK